MQDIFHRFYEWYIGWAGNVPDGKMASLLRLTLLFAAPTAIYYWAFVSGHRAGFGRLLAAIVADGLILAMPIWLPYNDMARAWLLAGCVCALACIPVAHQFLFFKEVGRQRRLRKWMYILMGILALVGLIWS